MHHYVNYMNHYWFLYNSGSYDNWQPHCHAYRW